MTPFRARISVALILAAGAANIGLAAGAVSGAPAATALDAGLGALVVAYLAAVGITLLLEWTGGPHAWVNWKRRPAGMRPGRPRP